MNECHPLLKNLVKMKDSNPLSFHTPGHKSGMVAPPKLKALWGENVWQYDLTEVSDLDNLHHATGALLASQQKASKVWNARQTFFLVNGTTVGIQASIMSTCRNRQVFVPRNVHKSIYNSLILANCQPIYLPIAIDEQLGIPLGVEPSILADYMDAYPECSHLIMVNPTYHGITYKNEECIRIAKKNGLTIIVDEAHGSHLCFSAQLPHSALDLGADLVVQSWHKTLPVLTQASALHVSEYYAGPDVAPFLRLLQTTSPSYLLLSSLECAVELMADEGIQVVNNSIAKLEQYKAILRQLKTINFLDQWDYHQDAFKLYIYSTKLDGDQFAEALALKNIYVEMSDANGCLLIMPLYLTDDILQRLMETLHLIDQYSEPLANRGFSKSFYLSTPPPTKRSLQDSFFAEKNICPVGKSIGKIAGDFIMRYPPGIPIVVPGEEITQEVIDLFGTNLSQEITILEAN